MMSTALGREAKVISAMRRIHFIHFKLPLAWRIMSATSRITQSSPLAPREECVCRSLAERGLLPLTHLLSDFSLESSDFGFSTGFGNGIGSGKGGS